jgi:hypothetical protein
MCCTIGCNTLLFKLANKYNWTTGQLDNWTAGQLDSWTAGQLDSWTAGQLDNWTTGQLIISSPRQVPLGCLQHWKGDWLQ